VDEDALMAMGMAWEPLRMRLMDACATAMCSDESTAKAAREELASVLRLITERCGPQNELLLRAMATKLMEYSSVHGLAAPTAAAAAA